MLGPGEAGSRAGTSPSIRFAITCQIGPASSAGDRSATSGTTDLPNPNDGRSATSWRCGSAGPAGDRPEPLGALRSAVGGPDAPADPRTLVTSGVPFQVGGWPFLGVSVADVAPLLTDPDRLARVLTPAELARVREFPVDKRRLDWLAGRVALKGLLRDLLRIRHGVTLPWDAVTIVSEQTAPRALPGPGGDPRVAAFLKEHVFSIAHAGGLAVATAAPHPIGIDVEPLGPLAAGVADKFLTAAERAGVPASEWLALWTAKEAAAKALGLGFGVGDFTRLEVTGFVYNEPYAIRVAGRSRGLSCLTFKDRRFVVSLAWQ